MSTAPPRPCPRCGALITGRCPRCRRASDVARGSAPARGYGGGWPIYARTFLLRHQWCGERADGTIAIEHSVCAREHRHERAVVVDHIVPIAAGGARLDPNNHQALCRRCNAVKARGADVEAIRRARQTGSPRR